jgi:2-polyprenyl-6-methoxyphenol hydroxylase-like FAD-dependent oxidoreductase
MHIAVAGGGIAGLTAALALAARGFTVSLFERATRLEEVGAGIQLSPNAMAVLQRLGVMQALEGRLSEPEALVIRSAQSGAAIARLPLGKTARERYGAPYCTLHRADLQDALVATARQVLAISFDLGAEVAEIRAEDDGVAFSAGGLERKADVLVAADGIHSRVRTGYFGHPGPVPFGRSAWRATVPASKVAGLVPLDVTGLWLGAGIHLVHYPVRGGESLNVVVIAHGSAKVPPAERFGSAAQRVIDAVSEWTPWPLMHVDAARPWTRGRVALVGDAAHAMAPSAAQGGAQAIEDAWVLAKSLAEIESAEEALAAFERARRPRVARVVSESRRNLNTYELRGPAAVLRNIVLSALPASLFASRLDWLFGWQPE